MTDLTTRSGTLATHDGAGAELLEPPAPTRVLLVEDDDGDALIVAELLGESGMPFQIERALSIGEAMRMCSKGQPPACALVDLGLPDASGLEALTRLHRAAPDMAVVVLTGLSDQGRAMDAVAAGAQDYLVKGDVDGRGLARAIGYAVERRRAQVVAEALLVAQHRQAENERLSRGLLPMLRVDAPGVTVSTRYQPGASRLLGGDFFDAMTQPDGTLRMVVGDVCGHGPAEAALGVALRIAWRTLTTAGSDPDEAIAGVEAMLRVERHEDGVFATMCDVTIDESGRVATIRTFGHPAPLLLPGAEWLPCRPEPPLGCFDHQPASATTCVLPESWALLLVTDGIYEGRRGDGRLGLDGFAALAGKLHGAGAAGGDLLDRLIDTAVGWHGGPLDDDIALMWLARAEA